ncbi:MAG: ATP-binding protein [Bacteroidales bacterium]|nr:ATP-binding protein [Bacteroidales bacterium]
MKRIFIISLLTICGVLLWGRPIIDQPTHWLNVRINSYPTTVFSILEDDMGIIWVGTNTGLYSYDGYAVRKAAISAPEELANAHVHGIVQRGNQLYLASNNGLIRYDMASGQMEAVSPDGPSEIRSLLLHDDALWLGSLYGLYQYDFSSAETSKIDAPLAHEAIYALQKAPQGQIYVGTYNGLSCFYPLLNQWAEVTLPPHLSHGNIFVNSLAFDQKGKTLWIGTEGALLSIDTDSEKVTEHPQFESNSIKSITANQAGQLLIGTDNGLYIRHEDGEIELCRHDSRQSTSIGNNVVWTICNDHQGNTLAGTEDGISIMNDHERIEKTLISDIAGQGDGNQVYDMLRDSQNRLWIGGSNGVILLNADGASTWYQQNNPKWPISHNRIRQIKEMSDGSIWLATDGSVNWWNPATGEMQNYRIADSTNRYNANWAYNIVEDSNGMYWIGSYLGGLLGVDGKKLKESGGYCIADTAINQSNGLANDFVSQILPGKDDSKWVLSFRDSTVVLLRPSMPSKSIDIKAATGHFPTIIATDADGSVWCGFAGGVCQLSPEGEILQTLLLPVLKPKNVTALASIGQQLWLSTMTEMWGVDKITHKARLLPLPQESYTCIYHDEPNRQVLLGTLDAIYRVDPIAIQQVDKGDHHLRIMDITLDGEPMLKGDIYSYINTLSDSSVINLPSDYRTLSVEVSDLDFRHDFPSRYIYQIDSTDNAWSMLDQGASRIDLPRLGYGQHTLKLKVAGGNDEVLLLNINVARPWYITWWAFVIYGAILIAIVIAIILYYRRRGATLTERTERALIMATVQNRISFLTDMAHELKTPLSLIMGPASQLLQKAKDPALKKQIEGIYNNSLRLSTLVHRAVEINRMENTEPREILITSRVDMAAMCRSVIDSYQRAFPNKHFVFTCGQPQIPITADASKMESVVNNLVSNACKYTDDNATISCSVETSGTDVIITVSDDGVGIPANEQNLIFQRLFRSARTANKREGTGIGLYLVKQYVEMHHGTVTVQSKENQGTTFVLSLPIDQSAEAESKPQAAMPQIDAQDSRPRILIVDDNSEIVGFVENVLAEDYQCVTASNGRAGLAVAATFRPDLIIADEMMPVMSGLQMCKELKKNSSMSSIPIILLTAKEDPATEAASVEAGVDIFMTKPFDATVLKRRVAQLLKSREALKQQLRLESLTAPKPVEIESVQEKQMAQITEVIETNIADPNLNVNYICEATGINSKQLYRLIKKVTGTTPVDYLRQIRLRKAALLLEQKKFNVSEVMYMVGFSSTSYFAKCFQNQYGKLPAQYAKDSPTEV